MISECPGSQKFKQPQPETIKCDKCSGEVEIWTDEAQAICPNCKKVVPRKEWQSCLDWCKYAEECVGSEAYDRYMKQKKEILK